MPDVSLNLIFDDKRWQQILPEIEDMAQNVKNAVFSYIGANEKSIINELNKHTFINVCLADDTSVQNLNRNFRGLDKPTNVLSFANLDFDNFIKESAYYDEIELGNIILAYETMSAEAKMQEITLAAHFCHLLTHGILHLCGYDHIKPEDAQIMEKAEIEILANLNIANPYEEN